jgi:transcriptional repressor NrdR
VVDSRTTGDAVRRRRVCNACKRRFTTYERVGHPELRVSKRGGGSEDFSHAKLVRLLGRVCRGTAAAPQRVAREVEDQLEGKKTVRSTHLAELVLERLREADPAAFRRLAASYTDADGQLRFDDHPAASGSEQLDLFADPDPTEPS